MKDICVKNEELPYEISEELKTLRTNIQFCGDDIRVIMLTSCLCEEGKSTITLDIVKSFAELGKKTLLIDADLRKTVSNHNVEVEQDMLGLTHHLVGQCGIEDIVYSTYDSNMFVIPSGKVPPNPSELLASSRFVKFIEDMKQQYDYVLVDCAPLGLVVDAAVVAPNCDGAILLIESEKISYRHAYKVKEQLASTQCKILGVVLNKVDRTSKKYYSDYYGHYGKYGKYGKYSRYARYNKYGG